MRKATKWTMTAMVLLCAGSNRHLGLRLRLGEGTRVRFRPLRGRFCEEFPAWN